MVLERNPTLEMRNEKRNQIKQNYECTFCKTIKLDTILKRGQFVMNHLKAETEESLVLPPQDRYYDHSKSLVACSAQKDTYYNQT